MFVCRIGERFLRCGRKALQQTRQLNIQEYQSKELLGKYGCSIQRFIVADSKKDAEEKMKDFDRSEYVVKAQILAGGRGKGRFIDGRKDFGGVFITKSKQEALNAIGDMIGHRLVTKQTGKAGILVKKVMIAEGVKIARETYLAILMDREFSGPVVVASPAGGVDIETVAKTKPHLLFKEPIDISIGMTEEQAMKIAKNLGFSGEVAGKAAAEIRHLYDLFIAVDATQVEINPFVETKDGSAYCVDAKLNFDDSARFRQKEIFAMEEESSVDERELEARKYNLNYISLDGNIACLVNGAGLAMATMDIIKLYGGDPANFLDVGGGVTEESVSAAFRIITSDPKVKAILVNIFGGIVNCTTIANGLINAFKKIELKMPLVVRLEGTSVEEARDLLEKSGLPFITATTLDNAAEKVVKSLKK